MFAKSAGALSGESSLESTASIGGFLLYAEADLHFTKESVQKYASCLRQIERGLGGRPIYAIERDDVYRIKARFVRENLSDNWLASTLLSLKRYLSYLREIEGRTALDPLTIRPPKRRYREVVFLTASEVEQFLDSIKLKNSDGTLSITGHRFRALVEMLLGSGLRISELLSLSRAQINAETREAKIVGKGGKERTCFFTLRAIHWLDRYLALRRDTCEALFVDVVAHRRMKRSDIWRFFAKHRGLAGLEKKVTPHILRHTAATQLLFNGCPIGHIKEILGHSRLETTCRYYLGVDHRAAKAAHGEFLRYES